MRVVQFKLVFFYPLHTFLIKMPLEKGKFECYNNHNKTSQSPFHFLISLFSWTPRDRLVNDPGALHVRLAGQQGRTKVIRNHYPIIYARYLFCGGYRVLSFPGCPGRQCVMNCVKQTAADGPLDRPIVPARRMQLDQNAPVGDASACRAGIHPRRRTIMFFIVAVRHPCCICCLPILLWVGGRKPPVCGLVPSFRIRFCSANKNSRPKALRSSRDSFAFSASQKIIVTISFELVAAICHRHIAI